MGANFMFLNKNVLKFCYKSIARFQTVKIKSLTDYVLSKEKFFKGATCQALLAGNLLFVQYVKYGFSQAM